MIVIVSLQRQVHGDNVLLQQNNLSGVVTFKCIEKTPPSPVEEALDTIRAILE